MVTICIPTYNQANYLSQAVESALEQAGVETLVLVSDDASTDKTPAIMAKYESHPRVRYFRHASNRGIAANAGWVLAQGQTEFLVRLDSDDVLEADYCTALGSALRSHPSAGVAHANVQEIDQFGRFGRVRRLARSTEMQNAEAALKEGIRGYRVAANLCMFRRAAIPSGQIYRSGMNFCEDWDLFLRLADSGWGNVHLSKTLARYRVWLDGKGVRAGRRRTEIEGIRRVFEETMAPAWRRRGWSLDLLRAERSRFAQAQARALAGSAFADLEKQGIIEDLKLLSPNDPALARKIWLMQSRFAAPLLTLDRASLRVKDAIKACISFFRYRA